MSGGVLVVDVVRDVLPKRAVLVVPLTAELAVKQLFREYLLEPCYLRHIFHLAVSHLVVADEALACVKKVNCLRQVRCPFSRVNDLSISCRLVNL